MNNTQIIKNGVVVQGTSSGTTVLDIQGANGQLFSVDDDLTGEIFAVSDISGIPILSVESNGNVLVDGNLTINNNQVWHAGNSNKSDVSWQAYDFNAWGWLTANGPLAHRQDLRVLNKNADDWVIWATRNTAGSEVVMDLSNVGTILTTGTVTIAQNSWGSCFIRDGGWGLKLSSGDGYGLLSLRANNIDALNITSTGAATFSSTISATTAKLSNLTAAYIPYQTTNGLANSKLYTEGTDISLPDEYVFRGAKFGTNDYSTMTFNSRAWRTVQGDNGKAFSFTTHTNDGNVGHEALAIYYGESGKIVMVHNGGNVGIGTTTPDYKLSVAAITPEININASSANNLGGIRWTDEGEVNLQMATIHAVRTATPNAPTDLIFSTRTNDSLGIVEKVRITSSGNVGIGTTEPIHKLDVFGGYITAKTNISDAGAFMESTNGSTYFGNLGTEQIFFGNASGFQKVVITNDGNVGIGTTTPNNKLEIKGHESAIALTVGGGGNEDNYGGRWRVYDTGSYVYTSFDTKYAGSWTNDRITILSSNGYAGIATTSPSEKLSVVGNIAFGNSEGKCKIIYNSTENSIDFVIN